MRMLAKRLYNILFLGSLIQSVKRVCKFFFLFFPESVMINDSGSFATLGNVRHNSLHCKMGHMHILENLHIKHLLQKQ